MYCFTGKNLKEMAKAVFEHLRHEDKEKFGPDGTPNNAELLQCLEAALPLNEVAGSHENKGLILPKTDPLWAEISSLFQSNGFNSEEGKVDILTWQPEKSTSLDGSLILSGYRKNNRQRWIGVADEEQWRALTNTDLAKEKARVETQRHEIAAAQRILREHLTAGTPMPSPVLCSNSVVPLSPVPLRSLTEMTNSASTASTVRVNGSLPGSTVSSRTGSHRISTSTMEVARSALADAEVDMCKTVGRSPVAFVDIGTELVMRVNSSGRATALVYTGETTRLEGGLYVDEIQGHMNVYGNLEHRLQKPKRPGIAPGELKQYKLIGILCPKLADESGTISEEAKKRSAYLTRDLERHGPDYILVEACNAFFETGCSAIGKWATAERQRLNEIFASPVFHPSFAARADDNNVLLTGGLNTNLHPGTVRDYSCRLAKFFRVYMETGVGNRIAIKAAVQKVLDSMQREEDLWKKEEFKELVAYLARTLFFIARNPHLIVDQVLQHFVFEQVDQGSSRDELIMEESDGESDSDEEEPVETARPRTRRMRLAPEPSNVPKTTRVRRVGTIKKTCVAYMCALKMAVGLEIEHYRMLLREASTGKVRVVETDAPFETVLAQFRSADVNNHKFLASAIAALNVLDKDSSSALNACSQRKGPGGKLEITHGCTKLRLGDFVSATGKLVDRLKAEMSNLFGPDPIPYVDDSGSPREVTAEDLWAMMADPSPASPCELKQDPRGFKPAPFMDIDASPVLTAMVDAAETYSRSHPEGFASATENVTTELFGAVAMLMGGVLRAPDLRNLTLADPFEEIGNIHIASGYFPARCLAWVGLTTKNGRLALGLLNFLVSRVMIFFLQGIRPLLVPIVQAELETLLHAVENQNGYTVEDADPEAGQERIDRLFEGIDEALSTCLAYAPRLSPSFAKDVRREGRVPRTSTPHDMLFCNQPRDVRHMVERSVCKECLGAFGMSFQVLRHVQILFKNNIVTYSSEVLETKGLSSTITEPIRNLHREVESLASTHKSVSSFASGAGHTLFTEINHYQPMEVIGDERISSLLQRASVIQEGLLTCTLKLPYQLIEPRTMEEDLETTVYEVPETISERLRKIGKPSIGNEMMVRLNRDCGMQDFLTPLQRSTALDIGITNRPFGLYLPCGTGKTLAFALPLSVAPSGFALVVVPYVALLASHEMAFKKMNLKYEVYDRTNAHRFGAEVFVNGGRTLDDDVRLVLAVSDTAMSDEAMAFWTTAAAYRKLNAVVIDEAHILLYSAKFRSVMSLVPRLGDLGARLIAVSGTLPRCFEQSFWCQFGLVPEHTVTRRASTTFEGRVVVNVLHSEALTNSKAVQFYACTLVLQVLARAKAPSSILIFSLTKDDNAEMQELVINRCIERGKPIRTTLMDGDSKIEERKEFMKAFTAENSAPLIAFSTSAAAEGVDVPKVGAVFVVGGVFGGLLALTQMLRRAGRGNCEEVAEGFFIYAPKMITAVLHRNNDTFEQQRDVETCYPFVYGEKSAAMNLVTFGSLKRLLHKSPSCGGRLLEWLVEHPNDNEEEFKRFLATDEESTPCGRCFGCLGNLWQGTRPPGCGEALPKPTTTATETSTAKHVETVRSLAAPRLNFDILQASKTVEEYICKRSKVCPGCGGSADCQANTCSFFGKFCPTGACYICFQTDHQWGQIARYTKSDVPKEDQYKHLCRCAVIVRDCRVWNDHKGVLRCTMCWFSHTTSTNCPVDKHFARKLLLHVWFDKKLLQAFLSEHGSAVQPDKPGEFKN